MNESIVAAINDESGDGWYAEMGENYIHVKNTLVGVESVRFEFDDLNVTRSGLALEPVDRWRIEATDCYGTTPDPDDPINQPWMH